MEAVKTVGIKYCGGCNPEIDRPGVVKELQARLPKGFRFIHGSSSVPWDIGVLICGCSSACAERPELMSSARRWILVRGPVVDDVRVPVERIAETIVEKLASEL